mgnify:CR=1 FL=1
MNKTLAIVSSIAASAVILAIGLANKQATPDDGGLSLGISSENQMDETKRLVLSGRTVYQITGAERRGFPSEEVFLSHGYSFDQVQGATPGDLVLPKNKSWYFARAPWLSRLPSSRFTS